MVVVSDTSPINYFILNGHIELLEQLYKRIVIPQAVLAEIKHPIAPYRVREWSAHPPPWLTVMNPGCALVLSELDPGERDAIALAAETHAEVLLIDDRAGRLEATQRGMRVAGTLSILDEADEAGLVDFEDGVERLANTSFRLSASVLSEIRRRRSR